MVTLYNDDCLNVFKNIERESIDLIATDPPYPITPKGCTGNSGGMLIKKVNMIGKVFEHNDINVSQYAPEFFRVLKDGSHCYVMTNHINLTSSLLANSPCFSWGNTASSK